MNEILINDKDMIVMKLLHYFITEQNYNPVIIHGVKDEIWLENLNSDYKLIRIATKHIHNDEQLNYDIFKADRISSKIKRKTLSLKMSVLNIILDLNEGVEVKPNGFIDSISISNEEDLNNYDKVVNTFPNIVSKLKFTEDGLHLFEKITGDINKKNIADAKITDRIFSKKKPYITYALILLNVLIFMLMYILGDGSTDNLTLLRFGASYAPLIRVGEYYRLVTSGFLHIGIIHLAFNMYALYIIGKEAESLFGHLKFSLIYFISMILGCLLSITFNGNVISAGASGAIFGVLGALLYFCYNYRSYLGNVLKSSIIPTIIISLFLGFVNTGIDNFCHIGGLVAGYISAKAFGIIGKNDKSDTINGFIMLGLVTIFLIYMAFVYAV